MVFTTISFLFFLLIVLGVYWSLPSDRWRHPFLFVANFFFYGWWNWKFTSLLFFVILISYVAGQWVQQAEKNLALKKAVMMMACALLIGILGYFKYANFFLGSLHAAFQQMGGHLGWSTLNIILPAGISFYIFQAISYVVTVYRGKLAAETSFIKLGVYLGFFPHLVAGPIIHAPTFLPQLAEKRFFNAPFFVEGCRKFALGFLYKAVFADNIAVIVNKIFSSLHEREALSIFEGCLGFYGQIYFDFAGYSLMAIGVANLLGYTLPDNFNFPYRATSLVDFWHRWHISLSTWLRDYLYIPLGGNRCSLPRNYVNIIVTMLLGGLWHGASWNYLLWGGVHGGALCLNHFWRRLTSEKIILPTAVSWILTQAVVFICWIPFRATKWSDTLFIFHQFSIGIIQFISTIAKLHFPVITTSFPWPLLLLPLFFDMTFNGSLVLRKRWEWPSSNALCAAITLALLCGVLFMHCGTTKFIYFQF